MSVEDKKILPLKYLGDPILREKTRDVERGGPDIRALAADMIATMWAKEGVGLAAPQVGRSERLFVYRTVKMQEGEGLALVNPVVLEVSEEVETDKEGCLSIPGIHADVTRPSRVRVRAMRLDGSTVEIEAEGLEARVFQHEIDHLDGVLFLDRLPRNSRRRLEREWEVIEEQLRGEG